MPAFYEQLKQQLTYPEAWGNSATKDFGKWRAEARKTVMECMQNLPPAPKEYDMSVVGTEQRAGYEARKNMVQCFGMVSHTGLFIGS